MSVPPLTSDFADLLVALADEQAEFLLIGGWALALHGYGRGTDDMDVFVRPTSENAVKVIRALVSFGAPLHSHGVTEDLFAQPRYGYRFGVKPNLIEVLTTIDGVTFDEAWSDHKTFDLAGRIIPYIGRRSLIRNKRAAGRPKDQADVAWLEEHAEDDSPDRS